MKIYFVTILCLFFSAVLFAAESVKENFVNQSILETVDTKVSAVISIDPYTETGYQTIVKSEEKQPDKLKGKRTMPSDSLKSSEFFKKLPKRQQPDILRYRVDPDVDADMPRMALDPEVDAKILKVYPHIGMGLLGMKKCPHRFPHRFHFKK